MSITQPVAAEGGSGFTAPGPGSFELPPIFGDVTKPMVLLVLSAVVVFGFFYAASRNASLVPGRLQYAGEMVYGFVRNNMARDNIGSEHYMKFVPYLFTLFTFILVNNYYGVIPFLQVPSFSRIGFIVPLALLSWGIYVGAGIWKHGPLGYLKHATMPGGVKGPILLLLVPLEFFSNIIIRPVTLTLRLFGNMFAGHLLLILFATGGAALLASGNVLYGAVGVLLAYVGLLWVSSRVPTLELDDPDSPLIELPEAQPTILSGLHFLLPVVVLVWALIVERLSPGLSAFYAVAFMIFILLTQRPIMAAMRGTPLGPSVVQGVIEFFDGLATGARNMVGIGVATAAAGIIVGTVAQTGLGGVMIELVEFLSGGNLIVMLVLTAVISLVLGLGLPTTANYIIVATLMAPIVVELGSQQGLIVPLIAVHLFVFYFGLMADVTPPVGLASFAAAAISRGDPLKTGVQAFYYSLRTVALPFIFVFNTQLLLIGVGGWTHLVVVVVSATVAMLVFAAATQNYFLVRSRWWETVALLLIAFTLFRPGYWMDMIDEPYDTRPPGELREIVEATPPNGFVRLQIEGMDAMGRDVSKVVMVRLGEPGSAEERLRETGMGVMVLGDQVQVTDVTFGSPAARYGVDFGMNITEVLVPDADRLPKEIMFVPALLLLGLVFLLQWRRLSAAPATRSKESVDVSRDPATG